MLMERTPQNSHSCPEYDAALQIGETGVYNFLQPGTNRNICQPLQDALSYCSIISCSGSQVVGPQAGVSTFQRSFGKGRSSAV